MKVPSYDELYPGRFLKSGQFKGRDVTLTIARIRTEALPDKKGKEVTKGILGFAETQLELVLNRTNGEAIKALFTKETPKWIGKRVTFYPAAYKDNATGEESTAIRVRGSPDIAADISFILELARKKPSPQKLLKTTVGSGSSKPAAPKEEPAAPAETGLPDESEGDALGGGIF
jgi:hypothetical protein